MGNADDNPPAIPGAFEPLAEEAARQRGKILRKRERFTADVPLRFWRQQAHFTTPASGTPEKAIRGLQAAPKLLERFGIGVDSLAGHTGASAEDLDAVLASQPPNAPLVMVDVEDAVALTPEAIAKARGGAVRCFRDAHWGPTLAFYRPAGLALETCIEDLLTVLPAAAEGRPTDEYPIDGIVWPKAEHEDELEWLSELLGDVEKRLGLPSDSIKIEFLVESAHGMDRLSKLAKACAPRLAGIIWGVADYSADTNLPRIENHHPMSDWARHAIVNVAGAYNVPAIDCMTLNYPTATHRDTHLTEHQHAENRRAVLDALREVYEDAVHGIHLGMSGKWVGHPLQLLMVLAAYRRAMAPEQVEKDLAELEAYQASVEAGTGATVLGGGSGYMADRATDRHVRARLRRAAAWGVLSPEKAVALGIASERELPDPAVI